MKTLTAEEWKTLAVNLGIANDEKEKRLEELESTMREFLASHKNVIDSDDPTSAVFEMYYTYRIKFKQLLEERS